MTSPSLVTLVAVLAGLLIIPAAFYRDKVYSPVFLGSGGVLLTLLGLVILTSPLQYETSVDIVDTGTGYTVTPVHADAPSVLNMAIGSIFALVGVAGTYGAMSIYGDIKKMERMAKEDDGLEKIPE